MSELDNKEMVDGINEETSDNAPVDPQKTQAGSAARFPHLYKFISDRIEFLYATQTNMMHLAGFRTRQAINERLSASCRRETNHDWWESVLFLPQGSLIKIGASEETASKAADKYNNANYYGGVVRTAITKSVAAALVSAISPWDVSIRAERMNRKAAERTRVLNDARKRREQIYGF